MPTLCEAECNAELRDSQHRTRPRRAERGFCEVHVHEFGRQDLSEDSIISLGTGCTSSNDALQPNPLRPSPSPVLW